MATARQPAICPFNPLHVMPEESLQRHILRCMKNYPNWLTCPYNALHRYPNTAALTQHMLSCAFKDSVYSLMEQEYLMDKTRTSKEVPIHIEGTRQMNLAEEDWDKDYQ